MRPERYLVEVSHDVGAVACARVVDVFLQSGSHFLTHADWGCKDGEHKALLVVEADSREEALHVVPPAFRFRAKALLLHRFSPAEIQGILRRYAPARLRPRLPGGEGAQAPNSAGLSASR